MFFALVDPVFGVEPSAEAAIDSTAVLIAAITGAITLAGSFLMFRGKTQDSTNWLLDQLRQDAEVARTTASEALAAAAECERHREADQTVIRQLRSDVAGLQAVNRDAATLHQQLEERIAQLEGRGGTT